MNRNINLFHKINKDNITFYLSDDMFTSCFTVTETNMNKKEILDEIKNTLSEILSSNYLDPTDKLSSNYDEDRWNVCKRDYDERKEFCLEFLSSKDEHIKTYLDEFRETI